MPYHRLGMPKYDSLGREYSLRQLIPQTAAQLQSVKAVMESAGVSCLLNV